MRICVVSYHTSPLTPAGTGLSGGMNVFIANLYKKLDRKVSVDIFVQGSLGQKQLAKNVCVKHIPHYDITEFAEALLHHHLHNPYTIVHTHYWLSGLVGLYLKTKTKIPWIHTFHTIERFKGIKQNKARIDMEDEIATKCDVIVSPTQKEAYYLHQLFPKTYNWVIPHGVDTNRFKPSPNGHNSVLFVGRIEPIKGLELLIEATRKINTDLELIIVGGPSKSKDDYRSLQSYALGQKAHFIGRVPYYQLNQVYSNAGMLVMPSYYESFGLAGLEAMACARPVICFHDTGLAETVNNQAGILVRRSVAHLARAINKLIHDHDLRHKLGIAAWKKARGYDWHHIAERYVRFYEKIEKN